VVGVFLNRAQVHANCQINTRRPKAWLREWQRGDGQVLFPSAKDESFSIHGVQYLLNKHCMSASGDCPSLQEKRVTVHRLRHTMAMDLLQSGVERSVIALWLGHESVETTQIYLDASLAMKEQALAKTTPLYGKPGRYQPVTSSWISSTVCSTRKTMSSD
jgi:site-specific recombinase XerD